MSICVFIDSYIIYIELGIVYIEILVFPDVDRVVNLNVVKNFCFSTNIMNPLWPLSSLKNVTALLALADNHCSQLIPKPSSCHQDMTSGWGFGHRQSLEAQDRLYQSTC